MGGWTSGAEWFIQHSLLSVINLVRHVATSCLSVLAVHSRLIPHSLFAIRHPPFSPTSFILTSGFCSLPSASSPSCILPSHF